MKRLVVLLLPALLVACPQAPIPEVKPPVLEKPFNPTLLGSLTVEFGVDGKGTSAQFKPNTIQNQTLTSFAETTLAFVSTGLQALNVPSTSDRYLMAKFNVTNNSETARTNLTLVAYRKSINSGGSAFGNVQTFGGNPVDVTTLKPINAMTTAGCVAPATVCVDNANADLQIFKRSEIATLTTASSPPNSTLLGAGEGILQYGFVARLGSSGAYRTIPANTCVGVNCNRGTVTLALRVPQGTDSGLNSAYRYSMTFLVFTDDTARITESLEEQGTNSGASARATALGGTPQIATMCGTTLTSSTFIPGVRTVGVGTDTAWIGGNFFDNTETAASFPKFIGNTETAYTGSNATLTARFSSLGGATLTPQTQNIATATTTNGGNLGIATTTTGTVTIRPKVNSRIADSFNYQISDGTCTSPNFSATVAAPTDTVWYIDSGAAPSGDGRSNSPFQNASSLNVSAANTTAANDFIYFKGDSSNTTALVLKNSQQVIGAGEALVVGVDTLAAAGTAPTIQTPMTVATGNTIKGLTFGGLSGTVGGTLTVSNASIAAGATQAINLTGGTLAVALTSVSSSGGTNNIALSSVAGSLAINGSGTTAGSGGALSNATSDGIVLSGVASVTLKNINLTGAKQHGINWTASSGTSAVTLTNLRANTIGSSTPSIIGHGFLGVMSGSATGTLTINGNSQFNTAQQSGIDISTQTATTAVLQARITNSSFTNNGATQVVVNFYGNGAGSFAEVSNNLVVGGVPSGISVGSSSTASTQARVNNNNIDHGNGSGIGIQFNLSGTNVGNLIAQSNNNTITNGGQYGFFNNLDANGGRFDLTTTGNNITQTSANALMGMLWNMTTTASNATLCAKITGNTVTATGSSATFGMRVRPRAGTVANTLLIEGITPNPATSAANVQTYLGSPNNTVSGGTTPISAVFISNVASAICNVPTF